ncbi:MAG: SDR family oxidoreductase [Firmicutes bacterium]|nr:SDR family oxidoreductase [Bacillota bacterium]
MDMRGKVAVITGGARGIGRAVAGAFKTRGAEVEVIDKLPNDGFQGDIADEATLRAFAETVIARHGKIDFLIHNAMLTHGGLFSCGFDEFNEVLRVGVTAPYFLTKLFMDHFSENASVVTISSTRYVMSQQNTESYSAAKGGITALTHAMAVSLAGRVRVNAVAPGWIDTTDGSFSQADRKQQPAGRLGTPEDIANAVLFLCGEESGYITGQVLTVDGGMTKRMIYHGDEGWEYKPE